MAHHLLALLTSLCFLASSTMAENIETDGESITSDVSTIGRLAINAQRYATTQQDLLTSYTSTRMFYWTRSSFATYLTIPYSTYSSECRNLATDFVYQNNLCDARDPQGYLDSKKAFYSCEHRCGHKQPYSERSREQCACDEICVVYDDCCRDMSVVCPQTYTRGKVQYEHLGLGNSFCSESSNILVSHHCPALDTTKNEKEMTTTTRINDEKRSMPAPRDILVDDLPLFHRTLKDFSQVLVRYRVADISSGIVFPDIHTLKSCAGSEAVPYFLPVLVSLNCSALKPPVTGDSTSAIQVLKGCRKKSLSYAITPFHRTCKKIHLIRCRCNNIKDNDFTDHVHNACIGSDESAPLNSRYQLWSYQKEIASLTPIRGARCINISYGLSDIKDGVTQISISILSVASTYSSSRDGIDTVYPWMTTSIATNKAILSQTRNEDNKNNNFERASDQAVFNESTYGGRATEVQGFIFVIEMSRAFERRLLCRSLDNYLTECELLDCVQGAILSHNASRGAEFGGSRCLVPTHVVVQDRASNATAPFCWCMQVLVILPDLHIWDLKMREYDTGWCTLDIDVRFKGRSDLEVFALQFHLMILYVSLFSDIYFYRQKNTTTITVTKYTINIIFIVVLVVVAAAVGIADLK